MTLFEASLNALEYFPKGARVKDIWKKIEELGTFTTNGKTPWDTISATLNTTKNDTRFAKIDKGVFILTKFLTQSESVALEFKEDKENKVEKKGNAKSFMERDLHPILATYLARKGTDVYTKTILHEKSNSKDKNQTWTHPDLVSLYLKYPEDKSCRSLLKTINHSESVILSSYEMKKEVNSDNELKQYYFQAVSNSSWANYGWLVAYKFNDELYDEIERLNQTFGIGVILLGKNIESCKVMFTARHNELDFRTIDKLCRINPDFKSFIENVERLINADSKYIDATSSEFKKKCDEVKTDKQLEDYCQEHNIV